MLASSITVENIIKRAISKILNIFVSLLPYPLLYVLWILNHLKKFQGYLLGNPLTTLKEINYHIPYAHGMGLISDELYAVILLGLNVLLIPILFEIRF